MLATIGAFLAPIWGWIITALGILTALVGAYLRGKSMGVQQQQQAQVQSRLDSIEAKRQSDEKVNNLPSSDLDQQLGKFMRD